MVARADDVGAEPRARPSTQFSVSPQGAGISFGSRNTSFMFSVPFGSQRGGASGFGVPVGGGQRAPQFSSNPRKLGFKLLQRAPGGTGGNWQNQGPTPKHISDGVSQFTIAPGGTMTQLPTGQIVPTKDGKQVPGNAAAFGTSALPQPAQGASPSSRQQVGTPGSVPAGSSAVPNARSTFEEVQNQADNSTSPGISTNTIVGIVFLLMIGSSLFGSGGGRRRRKR